MSDSMNAPQTSNPPQTTDVVIRTRGIERVYRQGDIEVHALRGVDLDIASGEFSCLAGSSGSGKSTMLNLIGCLDTPTKGSIEVGGHRVERFSRAEAAAFRLKNIGFVFQAYNLVPVLSAYENAEFTLLLQGVDAAERKAQVEALLERVGLKDMMHRRPHEMSGGQQQRVAVARALASRPSIVLADEPTANLDSKTSSQLIELMLELNESQGTTFLFSSHDPIVIEQARRIIYLRDGEIDREEVK